ncbi:MAG TPA: hypothetical protein VGS41_18950 [Chthonomonadales bacterium]|nr:hypothetical protein [Chthonomonadales bacterium]
MKIELPEDGFLFPNTPLPEVWPVEQVPGTPALSKEEIEARVEIAVHELAGDPRLRPGANVAVGVGSRGVNNLAAIVRAAVRELKRLDVIPFIVPAMGSHGGATAAGQTELLAGYGVTAEAMGAEIRATMETVIVGSLDAEKGGEFEGHTVHWDRNAAGADAVLLINRVKPHTDFAGEIESGLAKMCVIGLGKQVGAEGVHYYGARGLKELIPRMARFLAQRMPLAGGIGVLENEMGDTSEVHALGAADIAGEKEKKLLIRARAMAPGLPFDELDVLVIDEMGKNISGTGMDTHVIGRPEMPSIRKEEWGGPVIRLVCALDLTAETHGNAAGLGLADITTRTLVEKIDWKTTLVNVRTSGEGGVLKARLPLVVATAEDCVKTAIATCGRGNPELVRLARIRNTADTRKLEISASLLPEARANSALKVAENGHSLNLQAGCRG